jgi:hypothetical protein
MKRAPAIVAVLLATSLMAAVAEAQSVPSLTGDTFNVDLVTGPVRGSGRIIGLGGAYTALAYGADGAAWSPAAYAARTLWETDWFEWDLAFDYTPGTFADTDFDNDGHSGFHYSDFVFLTFGGRFTLGAVGFGALLRVQDYQIDNGSKLSLVIANYGASYALLEGEVIVGLAARTASLSISDTGARELVAFSGSGPEVGALYAPVRAPFRVGVSARLPVEASQEERVRVAAGLELPHGLLLPAEVQLGFAYQLGSRPLNRRFENPHDIEDAMRQEFSNRRHQRQREQVHRERVARKLAEADAPVGTVPIEHEHADLMPTDPTWWAEELQLRQREDHALDQALVDGEAARAAEVRALPREYLLLSSEVVLLAQTDDAVGLESFLSQQRQEAGESVSLGFRAGAEGEPVQGYWKVRLGSYLEPSRFEGGRYRAHGTFDTDVRLFEWDLFGVLDPFELRIGVSLDVAVRYSNLGVGVGVWH